jgi:hypothetical protein
LQDLPAFTEDGLYRNTTSTAKFYFHTVVFLQQRQKREMESKKAGSKKHDA